jgi:hypothetical protein
LIKKPLGRKERMMKEKMTNTTLMDSNLFFFFLSFFFKFSPVPGSKLQSFVSLFFLPPFLCSVALFLRSLFSTPMFSTYFGGKYLAQNTMGKEFPHLSVLNLFLSLPVSTKTVWNQHHHRALWEKRKPSPFTLLEAGGG